MKLSLVRLGACKYDMLKQPRHRIDISSLDVSKLCHRSYAAGKQVPNMQLLGSGIDVYTLNLLKTVGENDWYVSTVADVDFFEDGRDCSRNQNSNREGRTAVPDGVSFKSVGGCVSASEFTMLKTLASYKDELDKYVEVSAAAKGTMKAFGASGGGSAS